MHTVSTRYNVNNLSSYIIPQITSTSLYRRHLVTSIQYLLSILNIIYTVSTRYNVNHLSTHLLNILLQITSTSPPYRRHIVTSIQYLPSQELIVISLQPPMKAGDTYTTQINFRGQLYKDQKGLFRQAYTTMGKQR